MMKKHHQRKRLPAEPVIQNPVAKYAHRFNKSQVFKDKKNHYRRNAKHKGKGAFIISLIKGLIKAFKFFVVGLLHVAKGYPSQSFQLMINHRLHD